MTTVRPRRSTEAFERCERRLGALRVELRGGLIKDEEARFEGEGGSDGDALAFAAGEGGEPAGCEVGDAEHLLEGIDAAAHLGRRDGLLFEAKGNLVLDGLRDGLGLWLLEDHADVAGHLPGGRAGRVMAGDLEPTCETAAVELGDEAVEEPQEGRLAAGGRPRDELERTFGEGEVDAVQCRVNHAGVPECDVVEGGDHVRTTSASKGFSGWNTGEADGAKKRITAGHAQLMARSAPPIAKGGHSRPAKGLKSISMRPAASSAAPAGMRPRLKAMAMRSAVGSSARHGGGWPDGRGWR